MAGRGEEAALGAIGLIRLFARGDQRFIDLLPFSVVADRGGDEQPCRRF